MFGIGKKKQEQEAAAAAKRKAELDKLEQSVKSTQQRADSLKAGFGIKDVEALPPPAAGQPKAPPPEQKDDFKDSSYNLKEQMRKRGRNAIPEQ